MKHTAAQLALTLAILSAAGAAFAGTPECLANVVTKGSWFSGRTVETFDIFPSVSPKEAFKRQYIGLGKEGLRVIQSDKELGVITAAQDVGLSQGKTTSISVAIESDGARGSKVTLTVMVGAMLAAPHLDKALCRIMRETDGQ